MHKFSYGQHSGEFDSEHLRLFFGVTPFLWWNPQIFHSILMIIQATTTKSFEKLTKICCLSFCHFLISNIARAIRNIFAALRQYFQNLTFSLQNMPEPKINRKNAIWFLYFSMQFWDTVFEAHIFCWNFSFLGKSSKIDKY